MQDIQGEGINDFFEYFKKGKRINFPPSVRRFIELEGNKQIGAIIVCRTPIWGVIDKALNLFSFGKWNKRKKQLHYDNLMHLYMAFEIDGKMYRIEKNQVIVIYDYEQKEGTECVPIQHGPITLNDMLSKALIWEGYDLLYYDPIKLNCQKFIIALLKHNGMLTDELYTFINQDVDKILDGFAYRFSKKITDLAAYFDTIIHGRG